MNDEQLLRYSRHILLDELGIEGQERILASHVLLVGAGGLGSAAALYLATAGIGVLTLVDPDSVDLTNLQRQIAHDMSSVGQPKVVSAARRIANLNPGVHVVALQERLAGERLNGLVAQATVVLDCSDNYVTRHAVNRACVAQKKPLVTGSAIGFDGQVWVVDPRQSTSACYACVFAPDAEIQALNCATMGVFAPLVGIIGSVQAAEALKLISGIGEALTSRLLMLDAKAMQWTELHLAKEPHCAVCGPSRMDLTNDATAPSAAAQKSSQHAGEEACRTCSENSV